MNLKINSIKLILLSLVISIIPSQTMAGGTAIASLNGAACNFNTIADAIAAAQPNDVVNIRGGTYNQLIGEIAIDLTLVASRGISGCEFGVSAFVTVDGMGQTFDATGGLVKITNGASVIFRNMALTNASAVNGGIMAVIDESSVTLDNVDVSEGSALSAGGNVYISSDTAAQSSLVLTNGSVIYGGTVVTGDGGGVAVYNSTLSITEGSIGLMGINQGNLASNNGGGIYVENSNIVINSFESHIQNNQANNFGGGIYAVDSTVEINDATVNNNTTDINGGGLYLDSTNLTLNDASVNSNMTTEDVVNSGGGGIYVFGSSEVNVILTTLLSNTAEVLGGGILSVSETASINLTNGSDIINNSARFGGGIFTLSPLTIDSSLIRFNTASSSSGGGVRCLNCTSLSIINSSQVTNNTAVSSGGGIEIFSSIGTVVELRDSIISGNTLTHESLSNGGGLSQDGGTLLIDNSTISSNSARINGGGVNLFDLANVSITNSQFFNNSIPSSDFGRGGGALFLNEILSAQIIGSEFNANNSGLDGGAINILESNLIIDDSIISANNATLEGGGIYAEDSDLIIHNSMIVQNEAIDIPIITYGNLGGGGIKSLNSNLNIINSKINQNISNDIGGGVFFDGSINNSLSIQSQYGILSDECLPSSLGFNEYCSEVSNNTAIFGAGLMIRGSTNEQGINLSGVALNANDAIDMGPSIVSGVAIEFDITNPLETEVTMGNLILVENDGHLDLNKSIIFIGGNVKLNLFSTTIANNTATPIRSGFDNSSIAVQNSIIHQNTSGPLIGSTIPFISLCNNSQLADVGAQSFGPNLGDPQFIHTNRGEYRLSPTSPSLDACSFGALLDIDGNVRPNDNSNYDQGAIEMNANFSVVEVFMDGFEL
jgi:fibronectin-binding autotransporter adhesin